MEKKLSYEELDRLAQELASFARTDIPMPEGLKHLAKTLNSSRLRALADEISAHLAQGKSLSQALEECSFSVPRQYIAVLQCAEVSGDAPTVLDFAVDHARRLKKYRATMLTATVYPMAVIFVLTVILVFMANTIIPKFVSMFAQMGAELPPLSMFVIRFEGALQGTFGFVLIAAVLSAIAAIVFMPRVQDALFDFMSAIPGLTSLTSLSDTAVVMRYLNVMLLRNVPAPAALQAAALAVTRKRLRQSLDRMAEAAGRGQKMSSHLGGDFPSTAAYLFSKAEERGDLPQSCEGIARYCEDRFDRLGTRALALFEPLLIFFVAIFVGFLVIALYLPMFAIPQIVGR